MANPPCATARGAPRLRPAHASVLADRSFVENRIVLPRSDRRFGETLIAPRNAPGSCARQMRPPTRRSARIRQRADHRRKVMARKRRLWFPQLMTARINDGE